MSFLYWPVLLAIPLALALGLSRGDDAGDLRRRFSPEMYRLMVRRGGGLSRRTRRRLLAASALFALVALARPVVDRGEITLRQEASDLVVAFDISRSMFADDLFPNRLEFAKRKFYDLLENLKQTRVAVVGFSSRAFLIAPLTEDFASLKYLVQHMGYDFVSLKGTDMMAPLEVTADLLKGKKRKALLLFTDGGDDPDFSEEIAFAKKEGIRVFVYAVATEKGGVMRVEEGVVRDRSGNPVITRLNPSVARLAEETGGVYLRFSLGSGDMKELARAIRKRLARSETKERTIRDREELFYYPLALALLLFGAAGLSLPRREADNRKLGGRR